MNRFSLRALALVCLCLPSQLSAHGSQPVVTGLSTPGAYPDTIWAVTTSQGLFVKLKAGFRWLCEDAFAPNAGIWGVVPVDKNRWVVITLVGTLITEDKGCSASPVPGDLGQRRTVGIWGHPTREGEILVGTRDAERDDDGVFRTADGGRTWARVLQTGGIHGFMGSPASADRLWVVHEDGIERSDDGGQSFTMMPAIPEIDAHDLRPLVAHPRDPEVALVYVERFPRSIIFRTENGGMDWTPVLEVPDVELVAAFDADGLRVLLTGPVEGWWRSADMGRTWDAEPLGLPFVQALTAGDVAGELRGSTNVWLGGPWVIGESDDFGASWTPVFENFTDIESGWDCPPDTRGWRCCQGLCPGADDPTCPGIDPAQAAYCEAGPQLAPDGGVVDSRVTDMGETDQAVEPLLDVGVGAEPGETMTQTAKDGCQGTSGPASGWAALVLLLGWRRRRRY